MNYTRQFRFVYPSRAGVYPKTAMDRNDALEIRQELASGRRRLRDLSDIDFKGLIYWVLVDRFTTSTRSITLPDDYKEEVDVVVVEHFNPRHGETGLGHGERTHFFECKRYGGGFELADLGKLFCAAIRHQPETVALVSTRPLHARAQDYADLFFGRSGRFPRVDFHSLRAELLLGLPIDLSDADRADRHTDGPCSPTASEWRLIEHGAYHDRIIASSDSALRPVRLSHGRRYTIEARGTFVGLENAQAAIVSLLLQSERGASFPCVGPPRIQEHAFSAEFTIDPDSLVNKAESAWMIHVGPSDPPMAMLQFPAMDLTTIVDSLLPDLRSAETTAISAALHDGDEVMVLVSGEAGVGKSHLCRQIAGHLKFRHGYRVENFRAENVADGSLFMRMLLRLLTPRIHGGSEAETSPFTSSVVAEALRCLLHEIAPAESESLSQAIVENDLTRAHPDRIVPLLASLLVQSGDILLVLQDCHELPSTLISGLDALIVALDERDWAGTRIVLECRSGFGTENPAWTEFVNRVHSTLHSRTRTAHLRNLTPLQTEEYLRPLFAAINDDLISAMWSQTGGNPLLITSLLRSLVDAGAIGKAADPKDRTLRVLHAAHILEGRPLRAEKPRLILETRIRLLDQRKPRSLAALPSVIPILAILALTRDVLSQADTFRYFDLSSTDGDKLVRWLVREEILAPSSETDADLTFAHELIRDTVMELGRANEDTLVVAERIADEISPEGFSELFRMAQLACYIGDLRLCREYLNLGHEAAKRENRFHWSRRFQLQLLDSYNESPDATFRDRLTQLALLNDLGWSEHNAGSNQVSREYYREARKVAERLPVGKGDWTLQMMRSTLAQIDHRIMTIDLTLLDFGSFLVSADRTLERVSDPTMLGHVINRLVLGCSALGFAEEGYHFAKAGIELASLSSAPEVNAVLCTDISEFLAPAMSAEALRLSEKGMDLAQSTRQQLHSEFAYMRHRLWSRGEYDAPDHREDFQRRLQELGMIILEGSLYHFEGLIQLLNDRYTDARRLFSQAEVHARLYDQVSLEAVIWNNAMVAALLQGDQESAFAFSARLLRFWEKLAEQRRLVAARWNSLIATFEDARKRIDQPLGKATLEIPSKPPFTGPFLSSLVNLTSLHEAGLLTAELEPALLLAEWAGSSHMRLSAHPVMTVEWNGISLYLDP